MREISRPSLRHGTCIWSYVFIQFGVTRAAMPQTHLSMPPAAPTSRVLQELGKIQISTNEVPCWKNLQFVWLHTHVYICEQTFRLITPNGIRDKWQPPLYDVCGISTTRPSPPWYEIFRHDWSTEWSTSEKINLHPYLFLDLSIQQPCPIQSSRLKADTNIGLSHWRVRKQTPPPQVREQEPNSVHCPQCPSCLRMSEVSLIQWPLKQFCKEK